MNTRGLTVADLEKAYPAFRLGPLSFELQPGRAYGLLGPNGAGKTTLLNLLSLQLRPTGGEIRCAGALVRWGESCWKARLGYIRETPGFYDELTVGETLHFASQFYPQWDARFASALVERFRLQLHQRVAELSKGTKVKLGIVAALAHHAEVFLLDEPTAGLDPTARVELQQTVKDILHEHPEVCLLLSSHIFEDLDEVTDDVIILRDGAIVFHETRERLSGMVVYRVPPSADLRRCADVRLDWQRHGCRFVLVPLASSTNSYLQSLDGCEEEPGTSKMAAVYHGTEHL